MTTDRSLAREADPKLETLAEEWSLTVAQFIEWYGLDDVVPGICMNPHCVFTAQVEPDQRGGWCEDCGTTSVKSGLILAGVI